MQVVQQWSSDDFNLSPLSTTKVFATSGYVAINHDMNLILIALRGTRSFKDTIIDINTDMMMLNDVCVGCKVHKGFYYSFLKTWGKIELTIVNLIKQNEGFKVLIVGHSLGGAIASLIGMKVNEIQKNLLVVTMGQPMVGNQWFTLHLDQTFQISNDTFNPMGKLIRVTHKNDPVVKLPISDSYFIFDRYSHTSNEIFIDEEYNYNQLPQLENVVYCNGYADMNCAYGMSFTRDNTEHLDYFRIMGKCGMSLIS